MHLSLGNYTLKKRKTKMKAQEPRLDKIIKLSKKTAREPRQLRKKYLKRRSLGTREPRQSGIFKKKIN